MQYDFGTIDPFATSGVDLATMLNQWRSAVYTMQRGPTRPAFVVPGQAWVSDAAGPSGWVVNVYISPAIGDKPLYTINTTTGVITFAPAAIGGPFLPLTGGTLTGALTATRLNIAIPASPTLLLRATGNATDMKAWNALVDLTGALKLQRLNEAEAAVLATIKFRADGVVEAATPAALASGVELVTASWIRALLAAGGASRVTAIAATGTFTPARSGDYKLTLVGGGAAGESGYNAVTSFGGSGGGAGGTAVGTATLTGGTGYAVTIGTGGTAAAGNAGYGGNGTASTFQGMTANGGAKNAGGTATGGNLINSTGNGGSPPGPLVPATAPAPFGQGGAGGGGPWGGGGAGGLTAIEAGHTGGGPGAGGGGGQGQNAPSGAGHAGVLLAEYLG